MARTTPLDRALRPVARELHNLFGKEVVLRRIERVKDHRRGIVKNVVESEEVVRAATGERGTGYGENLENIEPAGIELSIADLGLQGRAPSPGDEIVWGTSYTDPVYKVLSVEVVHTGELIGMYAVTVAH